MSQLAAIFNGTYSFDGSQFTMSVDDSNPQEYGVPFTGPYEIVNLPPPGPNPATWVMLGGVINPVAPNRYLICFTLSGPCERPGYPDSVRCFMDAFVGAAELETGKSEIDVIDIRLSNVRLKPDGDLEWLTLPAEPNETRPYRRIPTLASR